MINNKQVEILEIPAQKPVRKLESLELEQIDLGTGQKKATYFHWRNA